jgi:Histidine kinase
MIAMQSHSMYDPRIRAAFEAAAVLPRWARGWVMVRSCRALLIRHAWQVALFCVAICLVLSLFQPGVPLWRQIVYSLPMGMTTWALIDGGRFFLDQDSPHLFPRGWRGAALILGGVFLGFLVGTATGDAVNGRSSFELLRESPRFFLYMFLFSMSSGIGVSLFFYNRGKSAYFQAELEVKSRQATEAQLKLLQSQLDPHMLFNTLANLRALIPEEPERAVQMLDQLGDFLRATLSASRAQEHSLQAEFDRLHDYLSLMKIRLGERLQFSLDLPSELAQIQVPTLILQSLVENAVLHGLEPKVGGGKVLIKAWRQGLQLKLQVTDDGMGFEASTSQDQPQHGFGLTQIRERLKSKYGELATIELIAARAINMPATEAFDLKNTSKTDFSEPTHGCQATLTIPLLS